MILRLPSASIDSRAKEISQYYMGFWPCEQTTNNPDASRITDFSGNEAHASIGELTEAEAWEADGFHSIAEEEHCGLIPISYWTHRFATDSLLIFTTLKAIDTGATTNFFGNGISASITGFRWTISSSGNLQFFLQNTTGSANTPGTTGGHWNTLSTYTAMLAFNQSGRSVTIGVDGAINLNADTTIPSANYDTADAALSRPMSIGGRPDGSSGLIENWQKYVHVFNFPAMALPTNLADLFTQYKSAPNVAFVDDDFTFA